MLKPFRKLEDRSLRASERHQQALVRRLKQSPESTHARKGEKSRDADGADGVSGTEHSDGRRQCHRRITGSVDDDRDDKTPAKAKVLDFLCRLDVSVSPVLLLMCSAGPAALFWTLRKASKPVRSSRTLVMNGLTTQLTTVVMVETIPSDACPPNELVAYVMS